MNNPLGAQLCRITVVAPTGRADLAVPRTTTVAGLIPVLLRHVDGGRQQDVVRTPRRDGPWVLQRLGDKPFDPDGTAETLDWLEGEEFHLRPATAALLEINFDDMADGVATVINNQRDHWRPTFNRPLFLGLAGVVLAAAIPLLASGPGRSALPVAAVVALALLGSCVAVSWRRADRALSALLGTAGCVFSGLAAALASAGVSLFQLPPLSMAAGGIALAGTSGLLLGLRRWRLSELPFELFGVLAAIGAALSVGMWLGAAGVLAPAPTAAIVATVFLVALALAPTVAVRVARIQGPQLPRTADELQADVRPLGTAEVAVKASLANGYLNVTTVSAAVVFDTCLPFLLSRHDWVALTLTGVLSAAVLLRARGYRGAWQRVSLSVSGTVGLLALAAALAGWLRMPAVGVLAAGVLVLVAVATRPPSWRPPPNWSRLANLVEILTAVAVVPLVLALLGVFAWARGLAG